MKRIVLVLIAMLLLVGCGGKEAAPQVQLDARAEATAVPATATPEATAAPEITAVPVEIGAAPALTEAPTAEPAPTEAPTPEPAPAEAGLVASLVAAWEAKDLLQGLYPMEAGDVLDLYGIDYAVCRGAAAFGDAEGYTNEVVLVEADGPILDEVEGLLQEHLKAVKTQFKGYDPEALALAEKAVLVREGDMLLFAICPTADELLAAFRAR